MNLLIASCFLSPTHCPCVGGSFRSGVQPPTGSGLSPLLFSALERGRAGFEIHTGAWFDIGHPESLARARREWTTGQDGD